MKSKEKEKKKAVFFDRDGVLIRPRVRDGKLVTPLSVDEFDIELAAEELVKKLRAKGFLVFVVTNQPDVARGKLDSRVLENMHKRLWEALGGKDILNGIYVCPHDDQDNCDCRKPKPGMLLRAAGEWDLDLKKSFIIGDHARDIGAGEAAGCTSILIHRNYNQGTAADEVADDLEDAVRRVLLKVKG